ncbi:hypothetical protein [Nocardia sp. BMG51109]|uniref:hypothetical protein n=1 Tax=Nocardia sp. BMG51109 TaxID=1056816 RepID=UPI0012EB4FDF|nr:hypothetical protein [Nocardia sp. BMG51109]
MLFVSGGGSGSHYAYEMPVAALLSARSTDDTGIPEPEAIAGNPRATERDPNNTPAIRRCIAATPVRSADHHEFPCAA